MRRLPALVAALLLPAAQPFLLGTALSTASLLVSEAPAQALSQEAVGKVAKAITVRIEGATQGSGVLVKRDGNRYTVLTAWHVVSGQRPGEELDIYTPDGHRHPVEQGSINRLGEVDMAVLMFSSSTTYEVARVGDEKNVSSGDQVVVAGFPNGSNGQLKLNYGELVANAAVGIDQGYQLLYRNETTAGMSGGVVLTTGGLLVGMHGRGELDEPKSQQSGMVVKTGINQGVPIGYYKQSAAGVTVVASTTQATSADDYLAKAKALLGKKGRQQEVIRLANQVLATRQSVEAYVHRAIAKIDLGDMQGAIADCNQAIAINPKDADVYISRGNAKSALGDKQGAIADLNQAIAINPQYAVAYNNRGAAKNHLGDKQGAIADLNQAIAINPQLAGAYNNRGNAKSALGDKQGAIADYNQSIAINPQLDQAYYNRGVVKNDLGDMQGAIADYNQFLAINPQYASAYYNRANAKIDLGDKQGAIADYNQAIAINPNYVNAYINRGIAKSDLGDKQGAIADYNQALAINSQLADAWGARGLAKSQLGDRLGACEDMRKSASLGSSLAHRFLPQVC